MHFLDDVSASLDLTDRVMAPGHSILLDAEQAIARVAASQLRRTDHRVIPFAWFVELATAFNPRAEWLEDVFRSVVQMVLHPEIAWSCVDSTNWDEREFHAHLSNGCVLQLFEDAEGRPLVALAR